MKIIVCTSAGALALCSLLLPGVMRSRVALVVSATTVSLFSVNEALVVHDGWRVYRLEESVRNWAMAAGRVRDPRNGLEVVRDLRSRGIAAYPLTPPRLFLDSTHPLMAGGIATVPLAGISSVRTVLCKESGVYLSIVSDEYGFNNPHGLWESPGISVAAIGDSYTYGICVEADETMAARIRRRYPATVNLGYGGNGPLLELATLREYGPLLKPKIVLWNFYEGNDLSDLEVEAASPLLRRYFKPDFSQQLPGRRSEVDAALSHYAEEQLQQQPPVPSHRGVRGVLMLRRLRSEVENRTTSLTRARSIARHTERFRAVLNRAIHITRAWGGHVVLVYLPAPWRYRAVVDPLAEQPFETIRQLVLKTARDEGIPTVDLHEVFSTYANVDDLLYPFVAHYTPAGYAVAADTILKYLESTTWLDHRSVAPLAGPANELTFQPRSPGSISLMGSMESRQ